MLQPSSVVNKPWRLRMSSNGIPGVRVFRLISSIYTMGEREEELQTKARRPTHTHRCTNWTRIFKGVASVLSPFSALHYYQWRGITQRGGDWLFSRYLPNELGRGPNAMSYGYKEPLGTCCTRKGFNTPSSTQVFLIINFKILRRKFNLITLKMNTKKEPQKAAGTMGKTKRFLKILTRKLESHSSIWRSSPPVMDFFKRCWLRPRRVVGGKNKIGSKRKNLWLPKMRGQSKLVAAARNASLTAAVPLRRNDSKR